MASILLRYKSGYSEEVGDDSLAGNAQEAWKVMVDQLVNEKYDCLIGNFYVDLATVESLLLLNPSN